MNNLTQTISRKEIVNFLKLNALEDCDISHLSEDFIQGYNYLLEHLIEEIGDDSLKYDSESGFFEYVGPDLPE